jgi:uncharacterized protein YqgQ
MYHDGILKKEDYLGDVLAHLDDFVENFTSVKAATAELKSMYDMGLLSKGQMQSTAAMILKRAREDIAGPARRCMRLGC